MKIKDKMNKKLQLQKPVRAREGYDDKSKASKANRSTIRKTCKNRDATSTCTHAQQQHSTAHTHTHTHTHTSRCGQTHRPSLSPAARRPERRRTASGGDAAAPFASVHERATEQTTSVPMYTAQKKGKKTEKKMRKDERKRRRKTKKTTRKEQKRQTRYIHENWKGKNGIQTHMCSLCFSLFSMKH